MAPASHARYWRGQVWPRRARLFAHRRVALALLAAVATAALAPMLPLRHVTVTDLATAGLGFAALAFGAAVSGSVLVLTAPAPELKDWAKTGSPGSDHSDYSDLIFAFTWSAMAQIGVVIVCVLGLVFGGGRQVASAGAWPVDYVWLGLAATVFYYAVAQLIVVVETISQIAFVLIAWWNRPEVDPQGAHPRPRP